MWQPPSPTQMADASTVSSKPLVLQLVVPKVLWFLNPMALVVEAQACSFYFALKFPRQEAPAKVLLGVEPV